MALRDAKLFTLHTHPCPGVYQHPQFCRPQSLAQDTAAQPHAPSCVRLLQELRAYLGHAVQSVRLTGCIVDDDPTAMARIAALLAGNTQIPWGCHANSSALSHSGVMRTRRHPPPPLPFAVRACWDVTPEALHPPQQQRAVGKHEAHETPINSDARARVGRPIALSATARVCPSG